MSRSSMRIRPYRSEVYYLPSRENTTNPAKIEYKIPRATQSILLSFSVGSTTTSASNPNLLLTLSTSDPQCLHFTAAHRIASAQLGHARYSLELLNASILRLPATAMITPTSSNKPPIRMKFCRSAIKPMLLTRPAPDDTETSIAIAPTKQIIPTTTTK